MKFLILSLAVLFTFSQVESAHAAPAQKPKSESTKDLLLEIRDELASLRADVDTLMEDTEILKAHDIACTVARRARGECDQVFEASAEVCFELSLVKVEGNVDWAGELVAKAEGGLGWTSAPDGKVIADVRSPIGGVIPTKFGIKVNPELEGKGSICMEMPIEPRSLQALNPEEQRQREPMLLASIDETPFIGAHPVPVAFGGANIDLLSEQLDDLADSLLPRLTNTAMEKMPSNERFETALNAAESIMNGELLDSRGELLSDQVVMDVLDVLPIPDSAMEIIQDPSKVKDKLPDFRDSFAVCEMARNSAFIGTTATDLCTYLNGLPKFDEIAGTLEGLPEAVTAAVSELIDGTVQEEISQATKDKYCGRQLFSKFKFCTGS